MTATSSLTAATDIRRAGARGARLVPRDRVDPRAPSLGGPGARTTWHAEAGGDVGADLPVPRAKDRRRAAWLYDRTWGRSRRGAGWPLPPGTRSIVAAAPLRDLRLWHLPGAPGQGTVVLAHPDRRYGGHWFVREGWIDALQGRGLGVVWFDQPGYGQGNGGSPFLYENVAAACIRAKRLDKGPVRLVGISLGAFAASLAAAHVPDLAAVVLESPYPTFGDWYAGRGWSADRFAIGAWSLAFRKSMPAVDARTKFAASDAPALVAWSRTDETTAPSLSQAVAEMRPDARTYVGGAPHLGLWSEGNYREAVMEFLAAPPPAGRDP